MRNFGILTALIVASCGQSKAPARPLPHGDGGQVASCEPAAEKAAILYKQAAFDEGLAPNLHADFTEANVHMVMVDCRANPEAVVRCVSKATSVAQLESRCLAPLDDAGEAEGRYFSTR